MQFIELLRASPKHTRWSVFIWREGKYRQFEPRVNGRAKGYTRLDQTGEMLLRFKPEIAFLYVHSFESTERGFMNVYLADWMKK